MQEMGSGLEEVRGIGRAVRMAATAGYAESGGSGGRRSDCALCRPSAVADAVDKDQFDLRRVASRKNGIMEQGRFRRRVAGKVAGFQMLPSSHGEMAFDKRRSENAQTQPTPRVQPAYTGCPRYFGSFSTPYSKSTRVPKLFSWSICFVFASSLSGFPPR